MSRFFNSASTKKAAACMFAVALNSVAAAQPYPNKAITLVVPFTPGGVTDASARLVGRKLSEELGQPVIVENRPGAGASIGAAAVAKAKPDGYTLLVGTLANIVVNSYVYKNTLKYDPQNDLTPVYGMLVLPIVVVTRSDMPYKTMKDVVDAARAKPGTVSFASAGNGSVTHLAAELLQAQSKTALIHIPYKGSAPAITDLLGGNVNVAFDYASTTEQHIKAGKLTALAVTGSRRISALPEVKTMAQAGFPGAEVAPWFALFAPSAVPRPVLEKLSSAMERVLKKKEVIDGFTAAGGESFAMPPAELKAFIAAEHQRWKPIIEKANIKPN